MTAKEFLNIVANAKDDFLGDFLYILKGKNIPFCVIGGLAVNAYTEPVVSLDLDVVIVMNKIDALLPFLKKRYTVAEYPNSINIADSASDLRIQIQTDMRYQPFIIRAVQKKVLGYDMPVAVIEDVLQGKVWAAMDETRRPSKRQKDLSDMMRLVETDAGLMPLIPDTLKEKLFR